MKNTIVPRSTCGSGGCESCPFSQTEDAFYAENTGCLPDTFTILELPKLHHVVWGCHSDFNVICGGFAKQYKENGNVLDTTLPIVDFTEFTYLGLESAINLAKVRKGINPVADYFNSRKSMHQNHELTPLYDYKVQKEVL